MSNHETMIRPETSGNSGGSGGTSSVPKADTLVIDPVCGMKVDPAMSAHRFDHGMQTIHFCSAGCRSKFAAAPEAYPKAKPALMSKPAA